MRQFYILWESCDQSREIFTCVWGKANLSPCMSGNISKTRNVRRDSTRRYQVALLVLLFLYGLLDFIRIIEGVARAETFNMNNLIVVPWFSK